MLLPFARTHRRRRRPMDSNGVFCRKRPKTHQSTKGRNAHSPVFGTQAGNALTRLRGSHIRTRRMQSEPRRKRAVSEDSIRLYQHRIGGAWRPRSVAHFDILLTGHARSHETRRSAEGDRRRRLLERRRTDPGRRHQDHSGGIGRHRPHQNAHREHRLRILRDRLCGMRRQFVHERRPLRKRRGGPGLVDRSQRCQRHSADRLAQSTRQLGSRKPHRPDRPLRQRRALRFIRLRVRESGPDVLEHGEWARRLHAAL